MPTYYPTNCDNLLPDHNCDPCEHREFGRIRSAGFVHKDFVFTDPTRTSEWTAGVAAKKIIVIPETNGELPEPSEKTAAGYGEVIETLLGYEFHAKFTDPNYASNCAFYNSLAGNRHYRFFYRTSSKVHITDGVVSIIPKQAVPNDLNAEMVWTVHVKWQDSKFPCPIDAPEGVFDCFI